MSKLIISKLFGVGRSSNDNSPTNPQQAIQQLRETEELLQKKSTFLETEITRQLTFAKKNGTANKKAALQALKRKHRLEKSLQQIDGTLSTIEFQREALENATTNTHVLSVMGDAAKALKAAHSNLNIDGVHSLMDEIADGHELANEISLAISNPVGFGQDLDDDDILAELELLEQEALSEEQLQDDHTAAADHITDLPVLPSVPDTEPSSTHENADDYRSLEAWAA